MKRLIYILLGLFALGYGVCAQEPLRETIVIGDVYDAHTGQPLANVNIYFQGTSIGAMSNTEGMFLLRGMLDRRRTMVVSAIGYHTERVQVEVGQQVGVQIALKEKISGLSEVFVTPGLNPALPLMDNVRKHRTANECAVNTQQSNMQTALYVSDIQSKQLQRTLWKTLRSGMLQAEDSTYLIPLYWRNQRADKVEEKATFLTITDYQILLNQFQSTCNFYRNNVNILSASLLSPLASSGNTYYNYYLADSVQTSAEKHYIVHFRTKNAFYATFNGEMAIDSATYALRYIEASVPANTSINYLRQLTIRQDFTTNNQLSDERLSLLLDFAIKADTSRIFPTLLLTRNTQLPDNSSGSMVSSVTRQLADIQVTDAMDSVGNSPLFRTAKFLAYILQTGGIPTSKYVEVGKLHHVIRLNSFEGLRIGIPLRTTADLWENISLEAFAAYATGDHAWKGMGQVNIALPSKRRHILRLRYSDEYALSEVSDFQLYLRENKVFSPQINIITRLMQGIPFNSAYYYNTKVRRQEGRVMFEDDWSKNIETQAYFKIGRMGYGTPTKDYAAQPSFFYSTLGASVRVGFGERKVDTYFHRRHVYNHLPVIYFGGEWGSYQTMDMPSYRMYGNVNLILRQHVDLGMAGALEYLLQAGLVFGKVPYPLLHIFAANQTHTFDNHRFTLMNTYQYAADQYVSLQALWDGKGVLFNLIPGIRYARLRELVELKVAYGGLRNDHQSVVPFPTSPVASSYSLLNPLTVPYVEMGVGIGNILRVGEVYGVFRLTNRHSPYAPWWAVRFRLSWGL